MPRLARVAPGGQVYHILNRANGRLRLFRKPADFRAFYECLRLAMVRHPTRLLGWCIMGNHWHALAWPREDGELSRFFGYLSLTHATRWQAAHGAVGTGHVYQARFKSFIVQPEAHAVLRVLRYVERNPLRAGLVKRAQDWPWSSLHLRVRGKGPESDSQQWRELLVPDDQFPVDLPALARWVELVNRPQSDVEEQAIAAAIRRGTPLGEDEWVKKIARRYSLQSTLRPRGRPTGWRKGTGGK